MITLHFHLQPQYNINFIYISYAYICNHTVPKDLVSFLDTEYFVILKYLHSRFLHFF